jgi:hypothetical protein
MNSFVRAAAMAAVGSAIAAGASFSAPSIAGEARFTPVASFSDHGTAGLDDVDAALNDIEATVGAPAPAAITPAAAPAVTIAPVAEPMKPGLLGQLWQHAAAAFGSDAEEAAAMQPKTLEELVTAYEGVSPEDAEEDCLTNAVYFEARGESIQGQLAVAEVVLNRAQSGKYPTDICGVVKQPWQFSFVRSGGRFPAADRGSDAWRKASAIAEIARARLADTLPSDVLWYHATYVSPSWGKRLNRTAQIGLHIFYS